MKPHLKTLVAEAAQALAVLRVERLEELALACQALNRDSSVGVDISEAHAAKHEMAALGRVLEATRSNVRVMEQIRRMHSNRLEYGIERRDESVPSEAIHGHD